jgi:choline-glycine betaine transporter
LHGSPPAHLRAIYGHLIASITEGAIFRISAGNHMKKLNVVGLIAFLLGLFVATLLKTSYAQLEEMLSHIQLLVVKTASTVSLIMVITWLLVREFHHLFPK